MGWPQRNATCHADQRHYAKGLCKGCYEASNRTKVERKPVMATCHPDRKHKGHGLCSACYQASPEQKAASVRRSSTPEYHRRKHLWSTYGLTLEAYDQMLIDQGGVCAICADPPRGAHFDVDHDHRTGATRGLLCRACNIHLSSAERDGWIEACVAYLTRHELPRLPGVLR